MSTSQAAANKAVFGRILEASNTHDEELIAKAIEEVFDPDVRMATPLPIGVTGAEAIKEVFATLHRAFPDLHIAVEDVIAEGDKVVSRQKVTGTHTGGEYMRVPTTGKSVTYNEIFIFRFANGRIVEAWGVVDVLSQLRQLGVMPA